MRILFMGTPDIAAECLKALYAAGHEICGVYTRRDKPVGRKQVLTAPPVKEVALEHGTPVFQPRTLRDGSEDANIRALAPDLIVVVAYGCILPKSVLEAPKYGCINLHVSLLPKYRGSAPVQWAVLNGDTETGVSIMQMDEGLDTAMCWSARRSPSTRRRPAASCSTGSPPWVPASSVRRCPPWKPAPSGPSPSSMRTPPWPPCWTRSWQSSG